MRHPARFKVLNWHRKARKTTLAINELIRHAAKYPAPYWYVGPSYQLARNTVWADPRMLPYYIPEWGDPRERVISKRENPPTVMFKKSGGMLHLFGADRPDLLRGPNPQGVILDEFSVQKPEIWTDVIQPVMRANPTAWCWFLFTPRGKNHAFQVFQYGLQELAGEWKSWQLTVENSGIFNDTQRANMRATSTQATFAQEYMCQFLEGEGSVFRNVRDVCNAIPEPKKDGHFYVIGCDLARLVDRTIIVVYDRATNAQVYQDVVQRLDWSFIKAKIKAVSDLYNHALVVLDSTGLGDPIFDDLARVGTPLMEYKFTEQTKKDLIENLSIKIEQRQIRMINMEETLFEFDNYAFELLPSGRIRYGAPEGEAFHDDIVTAHALAVWGLQPKVYKPVEPQKTRIQLAYDRAIMGEAYEQRLAEVEWANDN